MINPVKCAICGKEFGKHVRNREQIIKKGWGLVKGNRGEHYFCPDETAEMQVNYISKMCIGIVGSRKMMKEIRLSAIHDMQDKELTPRHRKMQQRLGLSPKLPCSSCGVLKYEEELEVNLDEKLLCSRCMDKWEKEMKEVYGEIHWQKHTGEFWEKNEED